MRKIMVLVILSLVLLLPSTVLAAVPAVPSRPYVDQVFVHLTWSPVVGATKYALRVWQDGLPDIFSGEIGNLTSYYVSVPYADQEVHYRIWAGNADGWSAGSFTRNYALRLLAIEYN